MKIKIVDNPEYKKGSARAKWFAAIKRYEEKDLDAFLAATTNKLPILTRSGESEAPQGWVRYFVREEIVELSE